MKNLREANNPWLLRKWYGSGAIQQPALPPGGLVIDAMGIHYAGPAAGFVTLSLSRPEDRAGKESYSPVVYVIVPPSRKHALGTLLNRLPGNAMPLELFFPDEPTRLQDHKLPLSETKRPKRINLRHGSHTGTYTIVEKDSGWSRNETSLFVRHGVECESLPKLPRRLVISTTVDSDEIGEILGHSDFTSRHSTYQDRWL